MTNKHAAYRGMAEAAKAMAHACLNLSHHATLLADDAYDPIADIYNGRQQCQEESENADTNEAADGDRRPPTGGDGSRGQSSEIGAVRTDPWNGYWTPRAEYRYAHYNAPGNPDSGH